MAGDKLRVNDITYEFGSYSFKLDGEPFFGILGVTYSEKLDVVLGYSAGKHRAPTRRTQGKYAVDGVKLTMYRSSLTDLQIRLAAKAPDGKSYGRVVFPVSMQLIETDETPTQIELVDCRIVGNDSSHEESADPLKVDVPLSVMYMLTNGLTLFDNSDGLV